MEALRRNIYNSIAVYFQAIHRSFLSVSSGLHNKNIFALYYIDIAIVIWIFFYIYVNVFEQLFILLLFVLWFWFFKIF